MRNAAIVFASQFAYIMLLGFQQINVVKHSYPGAATVSLALGALGFSLMAHVAEARHAKPLHSLVWWAYVLGGPVGICFAMWVYR